MRQKLFKYSIGLLFMIGLWACDDYERTGVEEDIYIDRSTVNMFVGDQIQLTASPVGNTFQWMSEDTTVARVANGLVEAVGQGIATVTASNGTAQTKVAVTVDIRIPLTGISLSEDTLELSPGDSKSVWITLVPDNANDMSSTTSWTSGNTGVAVVDAGGKMTAIAEGETSVIYLNGNFADTVIVYVSNTRPFNGPHVLSAETPCLIYAADFDFGGEGYAFHDSDSGNSIGNDNYRQSRGDSNSTPVEVEGDGTNIGYTNAGEWLLYTIDVKDAGEYRVEINLSAASDGGQFHLEIDGIDVTGLISVPNNGSWNDWRWMEMSSPILTTLTEGRHQLKFYFNNSGYNLRALKFPKN